MPFSITDGEPDTVSMAASSNDTTLIANADLSVLGTGANRTLRITPAPLGSGSAAISLSALDAYALDDEVSFVLQVTQPFGAELSKLLASDGAADDRFASSMAIDGGHAVVGAPGDDDHGSDSGSAYLFVRSAEGWVQSATPPPAPPVVSPSATELAPGDSFGGSAAISGDYIVVGASGDDEGGSFAGAAYVYKRCTGNFCTRPWTEAGKLSASDAGDSALFGASVAVDGDAAIVGAPGTPISGPGSSCVFERSGDNWNQVRRFAPDVAGDDAFGMTVDIDGAMPS